MKRSRGLVLLFVAAVTASVLLLGPGALGYSTGLGETTTGCTCHTADATKAPVTIDGLPEKITPGATYNLKIIVGGTLPTFTTAVPLPPPIQQPPPSPPRVGGFLLNASVGTVATNADQTQHAVGGETPWTLTHTRSGSGVRQWTTTWTVPANRSFLPATIGVQVLGVAANNNGTYTGDAWSRASYSLALVSAPPTPTPTPVKESSGPAVALLLVASLVVVRRLRGG